LNLAEEWKARAIIILQQKFCDPHELDKVAIITWFKERGFNTLYLELDATVPLGPFKIRVEALLETLREDEIW
jgi:benzoyl-CoA reductase subunit C